MSQLQPTTHAQTVRTGGTTELPSHLETVGAGLDFSDPNSALAPFYMHTSDVLAAALLAGLFFFLNIVPLWHTDIWGHLKYGQWIVNNHRLPDRDVLCVFADPEAKALHVYWLCQTGFYLVYHGGELLAGGDATQRMAGGVELLRTLHAFLVVGRCLLLLAALRRLGCSPTLACIGLFVLLLLSSGHLAVLRPQVLGEFFLAGVLLAVSRKVLSNRALILLPLVLVVWANCHASFVLGLGVLAACLVGEVIRVAIEQRTLNPRPLLQAPQVRRLFLALAASTVAVALFNPHGPFIYSITFAMSRNPNVVAMDEWQPLSFLHPNPATYLYLGTIVLVLGTQLFSRDWFSPAQLVLIVVLGVQPLFHQRMLVWWLLILPWLLLPALTSALERLPHYWMPAPGIPSFRKTVFAGLIVAVFALWSAPGQWLLSGNVWPLAQGVSQATPWQLTRALKQPGDNKEDWEKALAKDLQEYPHQEYRGAIFASETLGDFFSFSLPQATMPIYIDTHVHLFTPEHWQWAVIVKWARPEWKAALDNANVNLVVVEAELHPYLRDALKHDADWQVLLDETGSQTKLDPRCRLFCALRKNPRGK